jgi:hypothetical protein
MKSKFKGISAGVHFGIESVKIESFIDRFLSMFSSRDMIRSFCPLISAVNEFVCITVSRIKKNIIKKYHANRRNILE